MILYHGSYKEIQHPDLLHSRANVDFGLGFYTTPIYEQAEKWGSKFLKSGNCGVISEYEFDEAVLSQLKVKRFDAYSEEWLDFIILCRSGKDTSDYDLICGGVANDKVFNTIELFFDGLIDKEESIKRLKYEKPNMQVCFRTTKALSFLKFKRSVKL